MAIPCETAACARPNLARGASGASVGVPRTERRRLRSQRRLTTLHWVTTRGTVRFWLDDEGYGVIDSAETPGGCWAHFSAVAVAGVALLKAGHEVVLEWESAEQDGYAYRAVRTWPADQQPVDRLVETDGTGVYCSTLTITYDRHGTEDGTQ